MLRIKPSLAFLLVISLLVLPRNVLAVDAVASIRPSTIEVGSTLILGAPPRGSLAVETENYQPIADYLSRVISKKVVFQHTDNWLSYAKNMTQGKYDIVFDGPHFNGWRVDKINHTPLVKLPEDFIFVVAVKADNEAVKDIKQLAGRTFCAHAPPNLGTLTLLNQFDNPTRQPLIVEVHGWDNAYKGLIDGKCVATVLPIKNMEKFDKEKKLAKVIYKAKALPNQAISTGPRIAPAVREKIKEALLSEEGKAATAKLRSAYAGKDFVPASREEYAGLGVLLQHSIYYDKF